MTFQLILALLGIFTAVIICNYNTEFTKARERLKWACQGFFVVTFMYVVIPVVSLYLITTSVYRFLKDVFNDR